MLISLNLPAGHAAVGSTEATVADADGTTVRVRFAVADLLAQASGRGDRWLVRTGVSALGSTGSAPLRAIRLRSVRRQIHRQGVRFYAVTAAKNHSGRLVIAVTLITLRRVAGRLRRKLSRGGRR